MRVADKLFNPGSSTSDSGKQLDDYEDLSELYSINSGPEAEIEMHFADIKGDRDIIAIKDELYDGNIVVANLRYLDSAGLSFDRVAAQLQRVTDEIDGDIARKGDKRLVLTPSSVHISRNTL